jgi:hypothetical protein
VLLLLDTTRKDKMKFVRTKEANESFEKFKAMFNYTLLLTRFDYERNTIAKTDSSGQSVRDTLVRH